MAHKYDELQRLLSDQLVVMARTLREAETLGVPTTVSRLKEMLTGTNRMLDTVNTRIEAAHVDTLMERDNAELKPGRHGGVNVNPGPTYPKPPAPPPPPPPLPRTTRAHIRPATHRPAPPPLEQDDAIFRLHDGAPLTPLAASISGKPLVEADSPAPPPADPPSFEGGGGTSDGGGASGDW